MNHIQLFLDDNNIILGFQNVGENEGTAFNGVLPDDFFNNFKPKYYMLSGDQVIKNPNYIDESTVAPEPVVSPEMQAINALAQSTLKHDAIQDQQLQDLAKLVSQQTTETTGGTN